MVASGARAVARCDLLGQAAFSDRPDCLFRPYLGKGHLASLSQVAAWMAEAGMTTRLDEAGNLIGLYATDPVNTAARTLIIGSHLDSVYDGGRYDGPLGVLLGVECVASLNAEGRRLPFNIEVMAFGDEEGSRFPAAMLTSRAVAGLLDSQALDVTDSEGITLTSALSDAGLDVSDFLKARRNPSQLLAYVEAHIEQGPVLEAEDLALGVVTAIAAQLRFEVRVTGIAGHAGTNAMSLRIDALAAAAAMVLAIEDEARVGPSDLVATVGRMSVAPGAPNVVPGEVIFSIDIRAGQAAVRDDAARRIQSRLEAIAAERRTKIEVRPVHDLPASPSDARLVRELSAAVKAAGQRERLMVSGAGHDAMVMQKILPTVMLFIRCKGGISHNPLESVAEKDCDLALAALLNFIDRLESLNV